mmetsp:Transcript_32045/g.44683  ORF Transcript_32045/g.44683 Transcript_32045/m.44683 type:complete len:89 (+) Transcript_32045:267-533(+)
MTIYSNVDGIFPYSIKVSCFCILGTKEKRDSKLTRPHPILLNGKNSLRPTLLRKNHKCSSSRLFKIGEDTPLTQRKLTLVSLSLESLH